jgi:hypothetical protein
LINIMAKQLERVVRKVDSPMCNADPGYDLKDPLLSHIVVRESGSHGATTRITFFGSVRAIKVTA